MVKNDPRCIYERIIPFRSIPYYVFWPLVSVISFVGWQLLGWAFQEATYVGAQLVFVGWLSLGPVLFVASSHGFQATMEDLSPLLWDTSDSFRQWLDSRTEQVFTFRTWCARLVTTVVVVAGMVTVCWALPFRSVMLNVLALITFAGVLFLSGHTAYFILALLVTLRDVTHRTPNLPFYGLPHPAIDRLQDYYFSASSFIALGYGSLVVAVWQGPYGFNLEMQVWLGVLSLFPLSMFLWTTGQVHVLIRNAKRLHLKSINAEVQYALQRVLDGTESEQVERLIKLMDVQGKVQSAKEWPFALGSALAVITSLAPLAVQVAIAVLSNPNP